MKDINYYFTLSEKRVGIGLTPESYKKLRDATGKLQFYEFTQHGYGTESPEVKFLRPYIINLLQEETQFIKNQKFKELFSLPENISEFVIDNLSILKVDSFVNSPVKLDIVFECKLIVRFSNKEFNALKLKNYKVYNFIRSYGIPWIYK